MKRTLFAVILPPVAAVMLLSATEASAFDCADVTLHKNPPIPFNPFPHTNPATGQTYSDTEMIVVGQNMDGSIKSMQAMDFFTQLNDMEQKLNAWGYSLRDSDMVTLQELDRCLSELSKQSSVIQADTDKNPLSLLDVNAQRQRILDKLNAYKQNIPDFDKLWQDADNAAIVVNLPPPPPFTAPVPQAVRAVPKDILKTRSWSFEQGSKSTFYVSGSASVQMQGSRVGTVLSADGAFNASFLGLYDSELISGHAKAEAGKGKDPKISLQVNLLGKTVWNPVYPDSSTNAAAKINNYLHKEDTFKLEDHYETSWRFAIGPIPCKITLGLRAEGGLTYGYDVAATAVGGYAGPYAKADLYAQGGIDLGIASGGAVVTLTLLEDTLILRGDASIDFVDEPKLAMDLSASNDLSALQGEVSAYAEVNLIFKKWRGEYKVFSWDGFHLKNDIFHFKYTWTPAGVTAEGDVHAEDIADVAAQNHELQVIALENIAAPRLRDVMLAVSNDTASPSASAVQTSRLATAGASNALDTNVSTYLADLQKWLGT